MKKIDLYNILSKAPKTPRLQPLRDFYNNRLAGLDTETDLTSENILRLAGLVHDEIQKIAEEREVKLCKVMKTYREVQSNERQMTEVAKKGRDGRKRSGRTASVKYYNNTVQPEMIKLFTVKNDEQALVGILRQLLEDGFYKKVTSLVSSCGVLARTSNYGKNGPDSKGIGTRKNRLSEAGIQRQLSEKSIAVNVMTGMATAIETIETDHGLIVSPEDIVIARYMLRNQEIYEEIAPVGYQRAAVTYEKALQARTAFTHCRDEVDEQSKETVESVRKGYTSVLKKHFSDKTFTEFHNEKPAAITGASTSNASSSSTSAQESGFFSSLLTFFCCCCDTGAENQSHATGSEVRTLRYHSTRR
ncbi:MAG: hypothetical protein CMF50_00490 [Legionellales bacterium]|nr:hypothetical protein [Legionellales bacterium]|tara:strand:- start:489 stop:1568 length:1080 start_codon:yes stop_codon:yes gene_type:complete